MMILFYFRCNNGIILIFFQSFYLLERHTDKTRSGEMWLGYGQSKVGHDLLTVEPGCSAHGHLNMSDLFHHKQFI